MLALPDGARNIVPVLQCTDIAVADELVDNRISDQLILIASGRGVRRTRGDTEARGVADQTCNPV